MFWGQVLGRISSKCFFIYLYQVVKIQMGQCRQALNHACLREWMLREEMNNNEK